MPPTPCFHLAFPVLEIESTRRFYVDLLGCREGRSAADWIDFDFYGHQLSAHVLPAACAAGDAHDVDGDDVPVRHFGMVLEWEAWERLCARFEALGQTFLIRPHLRFRGEVGEQATLFVRDPSGNALEFKSFRDPARLFARG